MHDARVTSTIWTHKNTRNILNATRSMLPQTTREATNWRTYNALNMCIRITRYKPSYLIKYNCCFRKRLCEDLPPELAKTWLYLLQPAHCMRPWGKSCLPSEVCLSELFGPSHRRLLLVTQQTQPGVDASRGGARKLYALFLLVYFCFSHEFGQSRLAANMTTKDNIKRSLRRESSNVLLGLMHLQLL